MKSPVGAAVFVHLHGKEVQSSKQSLYQNLLGPNSGRIIFQVVSSFKTFYSMDIYYMFTMDKG